LKKVFSKIAKIGLRVLLVLLVLCVISSFLISMPFVQSWVVGKITNSLSETLETEVSIKSVNLSWSGKMKLNDILIKDKQSDSLFFIHQLQLKLLSYNKEGKKAIVGNVVIKDPLVNFRQRTGDDELNFQFLVDIAKKDTTGNGIWNILFKNIEIENGQFRFRVDGHDPPSDRTFDENDFAFNQINGEFKDFYLIGDSLDFKIKNLNAVEKNGLEIERLVCSIELEWNSSKCNLKRQNLFWKNILPSTIRAIKAFDILLTVFMFEPN